MNGGIRKVRHEARVRRGRAHFGSVLPKCQYLVPFPVLADVRPADLVDMQDRAAMQRPDEHALVIAVPVWHQLCNNVRVNNVLHGMATRQGRARHG